MRFAVPSHRCSCEKTRSTRTSSTGRRELRRRRTKPVSHAIFERPVRRRRQLRGGACSPRPQPLVLGPCDDGGLGAPGRRGTSGDDRASAQASRLAKTRRTSSRSADRRFCTLGNIPSCMRTRSPSQCEVEPVSTSLRKKYGLSALDFANASGRNLGAHENGSGKAWKEWQCTCPGALPTVKNS